MAPVIDISILNSATIIIVFLLVFVGGWGVLQVVNPFKDKGRGLYGLLAFLTALIIVLSRPAVNVILTATPWLMVLLFVAFFMMFFAKMFGVGDDSLAWVMKNKVYGWLIFFVALILLFSMGGAFGPSLLKAQVPGSESAPVNGTVISPGSPASGTGTATEDFGTNLIFTLFHPKIIAVMFLFLLGTLTILLLNN